MNLFTALDYEGTENQTSAALLAVLAHLSPEGRDAVMGQVVPAGLGPASEVEAQRGIGRDVLDGWLRWGHRAAVAVEAKVDSPLGRDQLQRYADWLGTRTEEVRVPWAITRDAAEARAEGAAVSPPEGVSIVWTSWDELARAAVAVTGTDLDALLAEQIVGRLRRRGIAAARSESFDPTGLCPVSGRSTGGSPPGPRSLSTANAASSSPARTRRGRPGEDGRAERAERVEDMLHPSHRPCDRPHASRPIDAGALGHAGNCSRGGP